LKVLQAVYGKTIGQIILEFLNKVSALHGLICNTTNQAVGSSNLSGRAKIC